MPNSLTNSALFHVHFTCDASFVSPTTNDPSFIMSYVSTVDHTTHLCGAGVPTLRHVWKAAQF
ncbi:hypothetical protein COLO4_14210 [Corchorus olitorius]|uniref:Uncharacterized protein n=1 Tax=Corchorus olitorius TaxID=93759 RepID=A0A1R3JSY1_9ROSI|nr:hypothetical protein COLO4_14210 [Corchorus olitorius]